MRKILNLILVFVMSLAVVGIGYTAVQAEATEDVTVTVHIHQFDGVYTDTGIGVYDGRGEIGWNDWMAVQSSVDDFGAVIVLNYTAAEINELGVSGTNIQFEMTSQAGRLEDETDEEQDDRAKAALLSPGNGITLLDVSSLKDGSSTHLEVYYVQGATEFVEASEGLGQIFFIYADPLVAANPAIYDDWNMWTENNGTLGTLAGPNADQGIPWTLDLVINPGTYDVPMKLGVVEVDADATLESKFIVRTNDWDKQCADDIMIDNTSVRGSGAMVYYYQAGSCALETDGPAYLLNVETVYELNAGNKFLETNVISSPTTVEVELLMPQNPGAFDVSRFTLKDSDGVSIPLVSAEADTMANLGAFVSDTVCAGNENKFILYVSSTLDHSLLGVVGSIQGWNVANSITSTKDDENGLAVFEICTADISGEFKVLYNDGIDDPSTTEDDESGFNWGDMEVTAGDNQVFDFGGERVGYFYIDANTPTVTNDFVGTFTSDFTPLEGEKTLIIHFETDVAGDKISIVGDLVQSWSPVPDAPLMPYISTKDDTSDYAVFEVPTTEATGGFKILVDADDDGFEWDDSLTGDNLVFDFGDADTLELFINADGSIVYLVGGTASLTSLRTAKVTLTVDVADELQPGNDYYVDYEQLAIENHVTVYVESALDHGSLGLVGSVQGWDVTSPILSTQDSTLGFAVFEFVTTEDTGEFKVLFNDGVDDPATAESDESGFNWGDAEATPGANVKFEVGESGVLVLYLDTTPATTVTAGTFTSDFTPAGGEKTVILHFDTALLGAEISVVGNFTQEWAPDANDGGDPAIPTPYISTKVDSLGYAVFELPVISETGMGEFKILWDVDANGFTWADTELTVQLKYDLNGANVVEYVINAAGDTMTLVDGSQQPRVEGEVITDMALVGDITQALFAAQYQIELVESNLLPYGISNELVDADVVNGMGTYAVSETEIVLEYLYINTMFDTLVLVDNNETEIAIESVEYTNNQPGAFTETLTCTVDENLLIVHLYLDTTVPTVAAPIGLVGSVQEWSPENAVASSGMDANGNYVFEVCVANTETDGVFKILQDLDENGFNWGDTEMTPGDIGVDFDGTTHVYVEEGGNAAGSAYQTVMLLDANELDTAKTYQLRFTDANGFIVFIDLDIDNEAPVVFDPIVVDLDREVDQNATFDIMDYFTQLFFIDNRDGEIDYTLVTDIDTAIVGEQTIVISATDMWNNTGTAEYTFTVIDVVNPVITLSAAPELEVGDVEPDWNTFITVDEGTVVIDSSQVDMDSAGTYYISFTVTDAAGNVSSDSLEITVDAVEVVDPIVEPKDSTGCFGSIGNSSALIIIGTFAVLGGAALFFIRKP